MPWWALALRLTGLGWYVALCIVLGILGGLWLDRKLDVLPLFTLLGLVIGSAAAFFGVYRTVAPLTGGGDNKSKGDEES